MIEVTLMAAIIRARIALTARCQELLPFELTRAQLRVLAEIYADLESNRVMQRLVQGDVGSGKTIVAWLSSLRVIENGYQVAWMAPTEMLAEQHFVSIKPYADKLGIRSALVTASLPSGDRQPTLARIARGDIVFIVGTHALIQESVKILVKETLPKIEAPPSLKKKFEKRINKATLIT